MIQKGLEATEVRPGVKYHSVVGRTEKGRLLVVVWDKPDAQPRGGITDEDHTQLGGPVRRDVG